MRKERKIQEEIGDYIAILREEAIPQLSLNCIILSFHERTLQVVVNRMGVGGGKLQLVPGGYVKQKEDLDDAVQRVVRESTGLEDILFRQFSVFGKANRSPAREIVEKSGILSEMDPATFDWVSKRFISLTYIALIDYNDIDLTPTEYFQSAGWMPVSQADTLDMDHGEMLQSAREYLVKEISHSPIAANLLPAHFTLPDFQALMESILERKIDRPNFRRKILGSGILEKVGAEQGGKGRPAGLYRFKYGKQTSMAEELRFGF